MAGITKDSSSSSRGPTSEPPGPDGGAGLRYGPPWAASAADRDPLRRLRGRLLLPVTVWTTSPSAETAPSAQDGPIGLTISSVLLGQGNPPMLAGLVNPATDLGTLVGHPGARFVVHVLGASQRRLAEHFAGDLPAPPEMLSVAQSHYGPVLNAVLGHAFCEVTASKDFGWSRLVEARIDEARTDGHGKALGWWRGSYLAV